MRKRKLSELVLDFDLYPRASIDTHHAAEMLHAVKGGAKLPPIIICRKSKRIVDGFHRQRVYTRLYGPDAEVDVEERNYETDADLFLDAIRYNVGHGLRMDTHDKTKCILRAKELRISATALAGVLHMDPKRIGELKATRVATAATVQAPIPLKRTIQHMAGHQLTDGQVKANESLSGMHQLFYVRQIAMLIENDLLDRSNETLMDELGRLAGLLEVALAAKV
jgi:hypothetical protein